MRNVNYLAFMTHSIKPAVINEKPADLDKHNMVEYELKNLPLGVIDGQDFSSATTQGKLSGIITRVLGNRVWQAPRWIPIPVQNIRDRIASFIAAKTGPDDLDQRIRDDVERYWSRNTNSGDIGVFNPRFKDKRTNAVCNDNGVVVLGGHREDELVSLVPSSQILPVTYISIDRNVFLHCKSAIS